MYNKLHILDKYIQNPVWTCKNKKNYPNTRNCEKLLRFFQTPIFFNPKFCLTANYVCCWFCLLS